METQNPEIEKMQVQQQEWSVPPVLAGYAASPAEAYAARDANNLLSIQLEITRSCNLRCRYCPRPGPEGPAQEADGVMLKDVIVQAKEMGARSVVLSGCGEPALYRHLNDLVTFIDGLEMVPVVATNAVLVFKELAGFLKSRNASVLVKFDSFVPAVQDFLAGKEGAYSLMRNGLENLLEAGFGSDGQRHLSLGATFIATSRNQQEAEAFWRYCRDRRIYPNVEMMTRAGRGPVDLRLAPVEQKRLKLALLSIDRKEYGYDWNPYTPVPASGCMRYLCGLHVSVDGSVLPCAGTPLDQHQDLRKNGEYPLNVKTKSLKEIYLSGPMYYSRHIDSFLEGKCKDCGFLHQCIGCRGCAFVAGIAAGNGPLQALAGECPLCFK